MSRQSAPIPQASFSVPRVPAWATPRARTENPVEAAFMAGSALNALDNLVQADPEWGGAWRHGRPDRIVIDGSQTNREAIIASNGKGPPRSITGIAETNQHSAEPVPQQSHRTGSSTYQAPDPIHALLQTDDLRRDDPVRHRDGSRDAQTIGKVLLQSGTVTRRAVRDPRCIAASGIGVNPSSRR